MIQKNERLIVRVRVEEKKEREREYWEEGEEGGRYRQTEGGSGWKREKYRGRGRERGGETFVNSINLVLRKKTTF